VGGTVTVAFNSLPMSAVPAENGSVIFKNNIVYNCNQEIRFLDYSTNTVIKDFDYNVYYDPGPQKGMKDLAC